MTYIKRTLWLHAALFLLAFLAFILPVVFGTAALLPVWLTGGLSLGLAACVLVDALVASAYSLVLPASFCSSAGEFGSISTAIWRPSAQAPIESAPFCSARDVCSTSL